LDQKKVNFVGQCNLYPEIQLKVCKEQLKTSWCSVWTCSQGKG